MEALVGPVARRMWVSTFHSACVRILRRDGARLGYRVNFTIYDQADAVRLTGYVHPRPQPRRQEVPAAGDPRHHLGGQERAGRLRDLRRPGPHHHRAARRRGLPRVPAAPAGRQRHGLRRPAAGHRQPAPGLSRRAGALPASASGTCWSTSTRTPTGPRTSWCSCSPAPPQRVRWSATATSPSTACAGPTSATSCEFEEAFPDATVVVLEQNYRSTQTILDAANAVIANNAMRKPKALWTEQGRGEPIVRYHAEDEHDEGRWLAAEIAASTATAEPAPAVATLRLGRHRRLLPHQRPEPGRRGGAGPAGHPLQGRRRHPVLRPARRSRTCSPTCGPSPTRPTRCRSSGSSTSPSAASATPAWPGSTASPRPQGIPFADALSRGRGGGRHRQGPRPGIGDLRDAARRAARRASRRSGPGRLARGRARADRVPGPSSRPSTRSRRPAASRTSRSWSGAAREADDLDAFLEEVSLVADADEVDGDDVPGRP